MKDSWRIVNIEVYEILDRNNVRNASLCVDFCDAGDTLYHPTLVQRFADAACQ